MLTNNAGRITANSNNCLPESGDTAARKSPACFLIKNVPRCRRN